MSNISTSSAIRPANTNIASLSTNHAYATLKEICLLLQIMIPDVPVAQLNAIQFPKITFKQNQTVFKANDHFENLYIVHSGFLKTLMLDASGHEQILAFPMRSDIIGIEGIHPKKYTSTVKTLSECSLIKINFSELIALGKKLPGFESCLLSVMSREIAREHAMICVLGTLPSEGKVARFLSSLSERFARLGYSPRSFHLRMTRQDIGQYLGITLETVSRTLSAFHDLGYLTVDQKIIEINDLNALRTLVKLPNNNKSVSSTIKQWLNARSPS